MDILKKQMAPVSNEAWNEINEEAKRVLESFLVSRKFLNVEGPKGWGFASVPEGRMEIPSGQKKDGVVFGIHKVQPLVEPRISFKLNLWELDNISRGASDADLDPLTDAATKFAEFEEKSVYYGLKKASMKGLADGNSENHLKLPENIEDLTGIVSEGVSKLMEKAIKGPYTLVAGFPVWKKISAVSNCYPLKKQIEKIIEGPVIPNHFINEAFLVPQTTEELKLILGQDISIGYESHTEREVVLFLTESFTLKIDNPDSVVMMK